MKLTNSIDTLNFESISKDYFQANYIDLNKPAILKGLLNNTIAGKSWSLQNLKKRIGDYPIKVFNINDKNGTSFLFPNQKIEMGEMLDLIETNSESDFRMFVNPILKKDKELRRELPCPSFFKCDFQLQSLLFIGGKNCVVPLHYDFMKDDGLLVQFFGRKDVILVDPTQSDLLYRLPFNSISMVNLFEPDYQTYPALREVKAVKITLHHGDTLFIPSAYWHQIKYVDASMSVAFRKWNSNPITTLSTAFQRLVQIPPDKAANFVLNKKWLNYKKHIANRRAEKKTASIH